MSLRAAYLHLYAGAVLLSLVVGDWGITAYLIVGPWIIMGLNALRKRLR